MGEYKFDVAFLEPALTFLQDLEQKTKEKVLYNMWKSRSINDPELLKKLRGEIWEFRTFYKRQCIRLFAFWDTTGQEDIMIVTHGMIKKMSRVPGNEIDHAIQLRTRYFNENRI